VAVGHVGARTWPEARPRSALRARLERLIGDVPRRELAMLAGLAALGWLIRLGFVLVLRHHGLRGDEIEYNTEGRFIAQGHWFWSTTPFGVPHPTIWKAPGYPLFVGGLYKLLGSNATSVVLVQTLFGPLTIALTWLLGRRLFGPRVAIAGAAVIAVYPFAWQFETRLNAEALVTPFTLVILLLVLERRATWRRAALVGVLVGAMLLLRPSAVYLVPALAAAWIVATGLRRGVLLTGVAIACAILTVLPWTIRNDHVTGEYVPISAQDQAPYGVFNDDSAHDPKRPWVWKDVTRRDAALIASLRTPHHPSEVQLRRILRTRAWDYVKAHPDSLVKAFFWNGLTRLWDVRRPGHVLYDAQLTGRSQSVTAVGLAMYWVLLPLSIAGLWLIRRRRAVVLPLIAMAVTASLIYTADAETRYRAPFEPLIVVLAVSAAMHLAGQWARRRAAV
jgi:4-amino-4-deoxy-L-arabinose transferase-like glycosyltransferase